MRTFTVYDLFQRNADTFGRDPALIWDEQRMDFQTLLAEVDRLAAGLAAQGLAKGDRVAILALNSHRFFTLFGAAAALGAIVVAINWRLSKDEILFILQDSAPKALFYDSSFADLVSDLGAHGAVLGSTICLEAEGGMGPCMDEIISDAPLKPAELTREDPFAVIYTAAMGGHPRGAVLSHGNIIYSNVQTAAVMGLSGRDSYLNMLPLFHITGLNLALTVMHLGGANVVMAKFDAKQVLALIDRHQASLIGSFPPILANLMSELDAGDVDLASLKHVVGIDGPDNITTLEQKTGARFWVLYGQTETSGFATLSPYAEKPGSAGRPGPLIRMKLVDDNEHQVAQGQSGEIVVRGPLVFAGFWQQEALNRTTFRHGWHHTGDLGELDADGYLWFKGRKPEKELIKPGGENVYPAEVEQVILDHPAVAEVSVIGVPDPKFGEGIKAVCVLNQNAALSGDELAEFVAGRIARFKKPRYVEFVAALPKTSAGSIDRAKVKELYGKS